MRKIAFPLTVFFAVTVFTASSLGSSSVIPTNPNGWSAVPSTMVDPACRPEPAAQPAALAAPQQAVPASQGTVMTNQPADRHQMPQVAPPAAAPQQPRAQSLAPMPAASPQPLAPAQAPVSQANVMPPAQPVQSPAVQTPVAQQPAQVQPQPIAHQQARPARAGVPEPAAQHVQGVIPAQSAAPPAAGPSSPQPQPQPAPAASITPGQGGAASVPAAPAVQVLPTQQVQAGPAIPAVVPSGKTGKVDQNATPAPRMAPGQSNMPADQGIAPQRATGSKGNRRTVPSPASPPAGRAAVPGAAREGNLNPSAVEQKAPAKCASCPSDRTVGTSPAMRPAPAPAPAVGQTTAPSAKESAGATAGRPQAADSRLDVRQPASAASPGQTPQKARQSRSCGSREPVDQQGQAGAQQPVAPDSGAKVMPQAVAPQQGIGQTPVAGPPAAVSPQAQQRVNWQNAPATAGAATAYPPQVSPAR